MSARWYTALIKRSTGESVLPMSGPFDTRSDAWQRIVSSAARQHSTTSKYRPVLLLDVHSVSLDDPNEIRELDDPNEIRELDDPNEIRELDDPNEIRELLESDPLLQVLYEIGWQTGTAEERNNE